MEQITVRTATISDLETLLQFEQGVIEAERPFDSTLKHGHINYYKLEEMLDVDYVKVVVAEVNNSIVASGYARIEESKDYNKHTHHAYLGFMYVLPPYRGKGINKLIIDALKDWALSKNLSEFRLQVYSDNLPAIRAYEKVGFSQHMVEMRLGLNDDKNT